MEGNVQTEYASLSGKIHTIVIDKTLSISGACADAKAVSDAIEKMANTVTTDLTEETEKIVGEAVTNAVNSLDADDVGAYSKEEMDESLAKRVSMDLLWENASPTSDFAAQTINIDLSDYNMFMVVARPNNQWARLVSEICIIGESFVISNIWGDNGQYHSRAFNGLANGVTVEAGYKDNSKDNNTLAPIYIYGIKGVTA